MNIETLRSIAKLIPVFTLQEIRKLHPEFNRNRFTEWQTKGYITKLRRGVYTWSDWPKSDEHLFFIANKLYQPSYVSLETALSYYGFIPEATYAFTSVSTKKTQTFETVVGTYIYHHIHPSLLFGYQLLPDNGLALKVAEPEKALLDFLYFHPHLKTKEDVDSLRLNAGQIQETCNRDRFQRYLAAFDNKELTKRAKCLSEVCNVFI